MDVCLGKKLGVVDDPRTFHLRALLDPVALPKPPVSWRFATALRNVPMFANDRYGCCTCASHGHRIVAQEYSTQQHEVALKDNDVLEAYSAVTGFNPLDRRTDNGAYMLDVANYMRRTGMGHEKDGSRHTIEAFVKVDHRNIAEVKTACHIFGGVWTGAWLPISAQQQTGRLWHEPPDDLWVGEYEPGSWGGHAFEVTGYGEDTATAYTWGMEQRMTWDWWKVCVDEAYAVISEDWLHKSGMTNRGFKVEQLRAWLAELA